MPVHLHIKSLLEYTETMLDAAEAAQATAALMPAGLREESERSIARLRATASDLQVTAKLLGNSMTAALEAAQEFGRVQQKVIEQTRR